MKYRLAMILLALLPGSAGAHYTCPDALSSTSQNSNRGDQVPQADADISMVPPRQVLHPAAPGEDLDFGQGLALDGNTLVVARDNRNDGQEPETLEVFSYTGAQWDRVGSLTSPSPHEFEHFYLPVLYRDTLLVGAWGHCNQGIPDGECANGIAYLFERNAGGAGQWGLVKELTSANIRDARFGNTVALEGDTAVVAASGETIGNVWAAGAVYVFERDHGGVDNWGLVKRLESDAVNKIEGDWFGSELSIVANSLVVLGDDSSVIYEFQRHAGGENNWGQVQRFTVPGGTARHAFDGSTLALNVIDPCLPSTERTSTLLFYDRDDIGAWRQQQAVELDYRLNDLSLEGNSMVAAAPDYDKTAYLFQRRGRPEQWEMSSILLGESELNSRGTRVALNSGRALVSKGLEDIDGRNSEGVVFFYQASPPLNAGHSGAWARMSTLGQGQLLDVDATQQFVFLAWFTYTDAASAHPGQHRWLTAQGHYTGSKAELPIYETLGGRFDEPQAVSTEQVGEVTLHFTDCSLARVRYRIGGEDLEGEFPIERVIPGSDSVCRSESGEMLEAVDINGGMDGAWYDPDTAGQGFLFDVRPEPEGGNFIFVAWFTYGDDTESGQRWLTAQGDFEGSVAAIDVYETLGGSFDNPQEPQTEFVGTMIVDFTDCAHAALTYTIDNDTRSGAIDLSRLLPETATLCEELTSMD